MQPPREIAQPVRLRDLLISLLVPLLVVLLINLGFAIYLDQRPFNRGAWLNGHKWSLLDQLDTPIDTLILGDSSCNQGVIPEKLGRALGGTALNLCTTGSSLVVDDAWMLAAYVERFGPPRRVVVIHVYDVWGLGEDSLRNIRWTILPYRHLWQGRRPIIAQSSQRFLREIISPYLPLISQEATVRKLLFEPQLLLERRDFSTDASGFMAVPEADAEHLARDIAIHRASTMNANFRVSDINQRALQELARIAKRGGFPLFVANSPIAEELAHDQIFRKYYDTVSHYLDQQALELDFERILAEAPAFSQEVMRNADHLTVAGAEQYTAELARALAR